MAKTVGEIMNKELFSLRGEDTAADALAFILAFDITGAAVLAEDGKPVGHISMRDVAGAPEGRTVAELMKSPVLTIRREASIEEAALRIAEAGVHRLVAVDGEGRAVGMASALDIIRGLVGVPARHPAAFPHYDDELGISFSDDEPLDTEHVEGVPPGGGVLALVHGKAGVTERIVWVEEAHDVRTRLSAMLDLPTDEPLLERALRLGELRFRFAYVPKEQRRHRIAEALRGLAMAALRPSPHALA